MSRNFLTSIDLNGNQLLNVVVQVLASDPGSPATGRFWFNSTTSTLKYYDGAAVQTLGTGVVSDATTGAKGIVQLAGDLAGTAASPSVVTVGGATATNIADAVTKRHTQHTDTGTTSASFQLNSGSSGARVKDSSGELQARNAADSAYADLRVKDANITGNAVVTGNLTVNGTTTTLNSTTMETGDNEIVLNSAITTNGGNTTGGIAIKRLAADNTTRRDAKLSYNESSGQWESTQGPTTAAGVTARIARVVSANVGDGSATSITVTHNLNTRDVIVQLYKSASTYDQVDCDVLHATVDTITLGFTAAPTTSQYRVVITG